MKYLRHLMLSAVLSGCMVDFPGNNTANTDSGQDTQSEKETDSDIQTETASETGSITQADTDSDTVADTDTDTDENSNIGILDEDFGVAGKFLFPSALGDDWPLDAVALLDGSIFITGYLSNGTDSDLLLMKLSNEGVLDTTFNGTGYVTRHNIAGGNALDVGSSINLTPDGGLLISGRSVGPGGYSLGVLWKVSTEGVDDVSFGNSGTYLIDIAEDLTGLLAAYDSYTENIFAVGFANWIIRGFRISADGLGLDESFGGDGVIELHPSKNYSPSLNCLSDGTLAVAGQCQACGGGWNACSWLVDTHGDLNTSFTNCENLTFSHNGLAGGDNNDSWDAILPYQNDLLILAGASTSISNSEDEVIARVNISDGSFDTSFGGGDGFWTDDVLGIGKLGRVSDAILKKDGSIVAALEVITAAGDWDVALIKLDAKGVRDMTFASGTGILQLGGSYQERLPSIIEQPDGRLLVVTSQYDETEKGNIVVWAIR